MSCNDQIDIDSIGGGLDTLSNKVTEAIQYNNFPATVVLFLEDVAADIDDILIEISEGI